MRFSLEGKVMEKAEKNEKEKKKETKKRSFRRETPFIRLYRKIWQIISK